MHNKDSLLHMNGHSHYLGPQSMSGRHAMGIKSTKMSKGAPIVRSVRAKECVIGVSEQSPVTIDCHNHQTHDQNYHNLI